MQQQQQDNAVDVWSFLDYVATDHCCCFHFYYIEIAWPNKSESKLNIYNICLD